MNSKTEKNHLLYPGIFIGIFGLVWAFYIGPEVIVEHIKSEWINWYGVEWFQAQGIPLWVIFVIISFVPPIPVGILAWSLLNKYYLSNFSSVHEKNFDELSKARHALSQSLRSIDEIEKHIKSKLEDYSRLEQELEDIKSVKDIGSEELKKKLRAISSATNKPAWWNILNGFILGIFSSLAATYIWDWSTKI
jgi:hypothetical protein